MKNIIQKSTFLLISTFFFLSACKKEDQNLNNNLKNFQTIINDIFDSPIERDFEINTSATVGSGLFHPFETSKSTSMVIEGFRPNLSFAGEFKINTHSIDFFQQGYYSKQIDTLIDPNSILGGVNSYHLYGHSTGFIDFSIDKYCPQLSELTYGGLNNKKRLRLNDDLIVNWNHDPLLPSNAISAIVVYTKNSSNNLEGDYFLVNDSDESITINNNFLSQFYGYDKITIELIRGYHSVENVAGKDILFSFYMSSWTTIFFDK